MPPAARVTDLHSCPAHGGGPVLPTGEPTVIIGGLPAVRVGDLAACAGAPDVIMEGSPTVIIGGRPAARMGDKTAHGGVIIGGCATVIIGVPAHGGCLQKAARAGFPFVAF